MASRFGDLQYYWTSDLVRQAYLAEGHTGPITDTYYHTWLKQQGLKLADNCTFSMSRYIIINTRKFQTARLRHGF